MLGIGVSHRPICLRLTTIMEVKESKRVVIAKPVASRPSFTSIRTFANLLTDSVTVPPHETVDAAIRPKTLRFKQPAAASVSCPQVEGIDKGKSCDDSDTKSYVVYKPKAKLVSQATVSALANMGNHQQVWRQSESVPYGKSVSQGTRPNLVPRVPSFKESETSAGDRSSVDGYNWRKYGQKQVKGSDCPRSYYKCTHPKCPVKKKVERSMGGLVSEIVYQGEHNHSKPSCPLPRCASSSSSSGFQRPQRELASEGSIGQDPSNVYYHPLWSNQSNDSSKSIAEKMNEGCVITPFEFAVPRSANSTGGTSDSGCRSCSQCDEGELDDPSRSKRSRKNEKQASQTGVSQSSVDSDSLEDGFRWRKYGQKVVGGNAHPRSYYRCTSANCRARKHVERASDDPRAFITTYEGKHNHHLNLRPPTSPTLPFTSTQHSNQAI
ncbi:PREDICTED: WRKY transcription factor 44-like isoform X3 [Brassica oleracea var. oleracea]|uniref:WRKY transcription factor 44-like isoform X3 n=1 Tax=Brassica oleracea var. oleracea TaxID=109376 RepID=UPI0006A6DA2B|nr:PREDICTED: WRKY transcription factor 44-like isoform X3 [Brassica oleracea var. oleracea]